MLINFLFSTKDIVRKATEKEVSQSKTEVSQSKTEVSQVINGFVSSNNGIVSSNNGIVSRITLDYNSSFSLIQ